LDQTAGQPKQDEATPAESSSAQHAAVSESQPSEPPAAEAGQQPPPRQQQQQQQQQQPAAERTPDAADPTSTPGAQQQQNAQTIQQTPDEAERLRDYVRSLSKKVQANLVYPNAARRAGLRGVAKVSFALQGNGQIRPDSLRIAASSGLPKLDAS